MSTPHGKPYAFQCFTRAHGMQAAWRCVRPRDTSPSFLTMLAPTGLRTTQFSILAKLKRMGPITINALARELVMDRTTLGRNILPLEVTV
jgi:DNA-binding MarR family transcriptional regulator